MLLLGSQKYTHVDGRPFWDLNLEDSRHIRELELEESCALPSRTPIQLLLYQLVSLYCLLPNFTDKMMTPIDGETQSKRVVCLAVFRLGLPFIINYPVLLL